MALRTIRLDNEEFEGLNAAYLLTGSGPTTLIDTGIATDETRETLSTALESAGLALGAIDQVLLTHWHGDHAGLAGVVQENGDADVVAHPRDATIIERREGAMADLRSRQRAYFDDWGIPPVKRRELERQIDAADDFVVPPTTTVEVTDGDTLAAGDRRLRAVHTPGHTAGHLCFVDEAADVVFSGDALLPVYTPNVGGADVRLDHPLAAYLSTLEWFRKHEADRAYPGHRDPVADPAGRAREILSHHAQRSTRVFEVVREEGPVDAWTVSQRLFGSVEGVHVIHGPGEAFAHLDHLAAEGILSRTDDGYLTSPGATESLVAHFESTYGIDPYGV
jgi:hydroxyacylglutathione hydrolase